MMAEEMSVLSHLIPFPMFSYCPKLGSNDLPLFWKKPFLKQLDHYKTYMAEATSEDITVLYNRTKAYMYIDKHMAIRRRMDAIPWDRKIKKAAFTGACSSKRQILFDIALSRPDLLTVEWTESYGISPWNPSSKEPDISDNFKGFEAAPNKSNVSAARGYLEPLFSMKYTGDEMTRDKGAYKYLIVMTGMNGAADRIVPFLRKKIIEKIS